MRNQAPNLSVQTDEKMLAWALGLGLTAVVLLCGVLELGAWLRTGQWLVNPLTAVVGLPLGSTVWTPQDTLAAVTVGLLVLVALVGWVVHRRRKFTRAGHIDRKAKLMGDPVLMSREAAEKAAADGHLTDGTIPPGLYYGNAVLGDQELWTNYRGSTLIIAGPERGKTLCYAIPFCMEAPGALIAMSNKRDLPDAVRLECETRGRWWCFDPMSICDYDGGEPAWWWNPLHAVHGPTEAEVLADLWANANTDPNATKSAFFDTRGPSLLSALLLAAAVAGAQMTQVFQWIASPNSHDPVDILRDNGFGSVATFLGGVYRSTGTEKSGLFSTAQNAVQFMVDPRVLAWITDDGTRPEFRPHDFVRSAHDTLMLLSQEGKGTAAPLTAALTVMTTRAAEEYARTCPKGRIPTPLRIVGDEMANVWRWQQVPAKASYYGGTGICMVGIFQNWSQGVRAYGKDGMTTLFEACTTRIIGGGLADRAFLADISVLCGKDWMTKSSTQVGRGNSMSLSPDKEEILDVDELYSMRDRVVVLPAAGRAVLAKPVPWLVRPYADRVRESITRYEPAGAPVTV